MLCWEPQCRGSGRTAKALCRCSCPLNVVFFKNSLRALTEEVRWPNLNKLDIRWPIEISSLTTESDLGLHQRVCWCDLLVLIPCALGAFVYFSIPSLAEGCGFGASMKPSALLLCINVKEAGQRRYFSSVSSLWFCFQSI